MIEYYTDITNVTLWSLMVKPKKNSGARAKLFGSEFLFWSLSRSLKFSKPARALVGSLKFLLVSQDPFIGLVIAVFSPLFLQETILFRGQKVTGNLLIHVGNG